MNNIYNEILFIKIKSEKNIQIKVSGLSMEPFLTEGDYITVEYGHNYIPGDILVYEYKNNELLVHRLLTKDNNKYYCKGDNSFRLEDVYYNKILGKVTHINGEKIVAPTNQLIYLSLMVYKEFRRRKYDIISTQKSGIYHFYHQYLFNKIDFKLKYIVNSNCSIHRKGMYLNYSGLFLPTKDEFYIMDIFEKMGVDNYECYLVKIKNIIANAIIDHIILLKDY